jgi:hypothetical protein
VDIHDDPSPAFQLRRYAWSAKLPLSVLTDFQEFAVYDCRVKPAESDIWLLRDGGLLGFIVPNKFFRTDYGVGLRSLLSRERAVARIVDFQANQVFAATTYTCLLFLKRGGADHFDFATTEASRPLLDTVAFSRKKASDLGSQPWAFSDERHHSLLAKLSSGTVPLLDLPADMSRGSSTGDDEVFVFEKGQLDIEREVVRCPCSPVTLDGTVSSRVINGA